MGNKIKVGTLVTILVVASFVGCNNKDVLPNESKELSFSVIDGDTVFTEVSNLLISNQSYDGYLKKSVIIGDTIVSYKTGLDFISKLSTSPDLGAIVSKKAEEISYIAIGGSLTAGFQDGGFFNEGMEMSFPNLLARQMGIRNFQIPFFEKLGYNGFGRQMKTKNNPTGGPFQKTNYVKNNLAKFLGADIESGFIDIENRPDVLAIPGGSYNHLNLYSEISLKAEGSVRDNSLVADKFRERLGIGMSLGNYLQLKKPDFFTFEYGWRELIEEPDSPSILKIGGDNFDARAIEIDETTRFSPVSNHVKILKYFRDTGIANGVLFKFPLLNQIPRFSTFDISYFENLYGVSPIYRRLNQGNVTQISFRSDLVFLPNPTTDSLLSPKIEDGLKKGLKRVSPLDGSRRLFIGVNVPGNERIELFNEEVGFLAKYFKYLTFDLGQLYREINSGRYVTHDGVQIDGRWPEGNFYSTDGMHPTSLGHLIIANEIIQLINDEKGAGIPLISITEYLNK